MANEQLAKDYFTVDSQYSENVSVQLKQMRKIIKCDIDLTDVFKANGNLDSVKIASFCVNKKPRELKHTLELILKKGVIAAKRAVEERKISKLGIVAIETIDPQPLFLRDSYEQKQRQYENDALYRDY